MNKFTTFTIVEETMKKLDQSYYPVVDLPVEEVLDHVKSEPLQVRLIKLADKTRVKNIVERYDEQFDEPIIAIVDDDTKQLKWLVDGHHRLCAHSEMKSKFIKTIIIPFIEIYNSKSAAIKLGHAMNVNVIDNEESSNEDIKALIIADYIDGEEVFSDQYLQDLCYLFKKAPTGIGRLRKAALDDIRLPFRPLNKEEAQEKADRMRELNPDAVVYHSITRVIHEQGLGALILRMSEQDKERGILMGYHAKVSHKNGHHDKLDRAKQTAASFGIEIETYDMGFVEKDEYK